MFMDIMTSFSVWRFLRRYLYIDIYRI